MLSFSTSLLGIGNETIVPSSKIGLMIPPFVLSNPLRLKTTFIALTFYH